MTTLEPPPRDVPRSLTTGDDAAAPAPRIVNGLTVRPRKKVNLWHYGLLLLPDFVALPIVVGLGMHRLLRYLDTKGKKEADIG
jgi:hypothetical protein